MSRVHGYCTKCRRVKRVTVISWTRPLPLGICRDCEEKRAQAQHR